MPEPVLAAIAAAFASRGVAHLIRLIKDRFADDPNALRVLDAADGAPEDSPEVHRLTALLHDAETQDPEFAAELRDEYDRVITSQHADDAGVNNQISGTAQGPVVQGRDISGGVSFS